MSHERVTGFRMLTAEQAEVIDEICDRYEAAWKDNNPPDLGGFMQNVEPTIRTALLQELARIDAAIHARSRSPSAAADFHSRFDDLDHAWLQSLLGEHNPGVGQPSLGQPHKPQLADYEVVREIGRGGMGVAYQARDIRLGRLVCLKVLNSDKKQTPERFARLRREARAVGVLNHPNLCTLYDLQETDGNPCLVLEWIEGETLRALYKRGCDFDKLLGCFFQIATALNAAHRAGIVHRDIKPENVMIRSDGLVKVLDFGLARLTELEAAQSEYIDHSLSNTAEGAILGTARYMSPEQARGETATSASDIFALGILFYELTGSRHPFPGDVIPTILHSIIANEPPALREVEPRLSPSFCGLVMRMLSKHPAGRPTAAEVAEALSKESDSGQATVFHWRTLETPAEPRLIVGRSEELLMLHQACETVAAGRGGVVCIGGEPGIGKTTLVESYLEQMASRHSIFAAIGRCSQRLSNSDAYLPILDAIESLGAGDARSVAWPILKSTAPSWYELVVSIDERSAAPPGPPSSTTRLKREFKAFLAELGRARPVVLFIDDVHWLDESTVELLAYLGSEILSFRCLILATYRPTELALSDHPFARLQLDLQSAGKLRDVRLQLLGEEDVVQFLTQRYPANDFPPTLASTLYRHTEGSPLFLVGLVQFLEAQNKIVERDGRWRLREELSQLGRELPDSISGLIDRKLGYLTKQDRRILQLAAVQGYDFDAAVVADAGKLDRIDVEDHLSNIERVHGLVVPLGEREFPNGTVTTRYRFVHVLYQNALDASITPSRKAAWSLAVATTLEGFYGPQAGEIALELAMAYEAARDYPAAVRWLEVSVRKAVSLSANHEAVEQLCRALEMIKKMPASSARDGMEFGLQFSLGFTTSFLRGYSNEQAVAAYKRAEELSGFLPPSEELFCMLHGLWMFHFVRMDIPSLNHIHDRMQDFLKVMPSPWTTFGVYVSLAVANQHQGNVETAMLWFETVFKMKEHGIEQDRATVARMSPPFGAVSRGISSWGYSLTGRFDDGLRLLAEALHIARELDVPQFLVQSWYFTGKNCYLRREPEKVLSWATQTVEVSEKIDLPFYLTLGQLSKWWAEIQLATSLDETHHQAAEAARGMLIGMRERGMMMSTPLLMTQAAESFAKLERYDEAIAMLHEAISISRSYGERFWETGALHQLGLAQILGRRDTETGLRILREGIELAQSQGLKTMELRCLCDFVRFTNDDRLRKEAREQLSALNSTFTQGFDTRDLVEAKTLLSG